MSTKGGPVLSLPERRQRDPRHRPPTDLIFVIGVDGRLFGLDLGTGDIRFGPFQFVPPYAKPWSLNLKDGFVFTTTSQNCGGDRSGIYSMQVNDPVRRVTHETLVRNGSGAGMWNRGGTAISPEGKLFVTTGDGAFDPTQGDYGSTFLETSRLIFGSVTTTARRTGARLTRGTWTCPPVSCSGLLIGTTICWSAAGKELSVYLLNADELGSKVTLRRSMSHRRLEMLERCSKKKGCGALQFFGRTKRAALDLRRRSGVPRRRRGQVSGDERRRFAWLSACVQGRNAARWTISLPEAGLDFPDVDLPDAPAVANGVLFVVATGENPAVNARTCEADRTEEPTDHRRTRADTHPAD